MAKESSQILILDVKQSICLPKGIIRIRVIFRAVTPLYNSFIVLYNPIIIMLSVLLLCPPVKKKKTGSTVLLFILLSCVS